MMKINLLPHRQIKRAERQRQFILLVVVTVVASSAVVFMGETLVSTKIAMQSERNARLEQAIARLDSQISEISTLKTQIADVLERKQVVENLQSNRGQSVILLDEIARQLPDGIFLKAIKQQGMQVNIEGFADTNARIASLVRNLSVSKYLESPSLTEIKSVSVSGSKLNNFTLTVKIRSSQLQNKAP